MGVKKRWILLVCAMTLFLGVHPLWAQEGVKGVAKEVINSGGYTYLNIQTDKGETWVALPPVNVKKGDRVEVASDDAMVMENFKSRSLNRTFSRILFATKVRVNGKVEPSGGEFHGGSSQGAGRVMAPDFQLPGEKGQKKVATNPHEGMGTKGAFHGGSPHGGMGFEVPFPPKGSIKPPKGGYTVAQLYQKAKELDGKEVTVRGKVVKYLPGIMGKNWLHVADGSGEDGKAQVTVTTQATVKPGDVVLVKGKLAANKDFGYGYFYKVIIEDAQVKVEGK